MEHGGVDSFSVGLCVWAHEVGLLGLEKVPVFYLNYAPANWEEFCVIFFKTLKSTLMF